CRCPESGRSESYLRAVAEGDDARGALLQRNVAFAQLQLIAQCVRVVQLERRRGSFVENAKRFTRPVVQVARHTLVRKQQRSCFFALLLEDGVTAFRVFTCSKVGVEQATTTQERLDVLVLDVERHLFERELDVF